MRTVLRAFIPAVLMLLTAGLASAQTVRVVANEAAVRLRPDPNSPSIATVQAGALLQVRSKEGFWYSVSLSADNSQGAVRVGYISATDVETFSSSPTGLASPSPPSVSGGSAPSDEWKRRFDRIQSRRSSGKKKFWIGTVAEAAGIGLLSYWSSNAGVQCDASYYCYETVSNSVYNAGIASLLGGGAVSTWGLFQWVFANGDLQALELERQRSQPSASASSEFRQLASTGFRVTHTFSW